MTIKAYSIEEELRYHAKIIRHKKRSFLTSIRKNFKAIEKLAKSNGLEIKLSAEDYTYTFH